MKISNFGIKIDSPYQKKLGMAIQLLHGALLLAINYDVTLEFEKVMIRSGTIDSDTTDPDNTKS
ncbi:hypothetical protein B4923_16160 [Brenneria roseae subsp. americana]|uniref:Uncharacterized protein n=1 Tax=Brenneria roseae subsp. americana TaxID=1508507 RepID=A0A2U1TMJ8_9GAMM|nr:hypothetical protein [Brenneria roseae]PWC10654.1 hypothetical protein B4923_16160 [Brenneria roseae subsp. americana]